MNLATPPSMFFLMKITLGGAMKPRNEIWVVVVLALALAATIVKWDDWFGAETKTPQPSPEATTIHTLQYETWSDALNQGAIYSDDYRYRKNSRY